MTIGTEAWPNLFLGEHIIRNFFAVYTVQEQISFSCTRNIILRFPCLSSTEHSLQKKKKKDDNSIKTPGSYGELAYRLECSTYEYQNWYIEGLNNCLSSCLSLSTSIGQRQKKMYYIEANLDVNLPKNYPSVRNISAVNFSFCPFFAKPFLK